MRQVRAILAVTEILLFLVLIFPPFVENRPLARAIVAYHNEPSGENKNELEHQRAAVRASRFRHSCSYRRALGGQFRKFILRFKAHTVSSWSCRLFPGKGGEGDFLARSAQLT